MNLYLVYLEWAEKCFRINAEALRFLRTLVPVGSRIIRARHDADFLRHLPDATHVLTWHFKKEWFAKAPKLKLLATPGAGRELVSYEAPSGVTVHFGHFHGAIMSETVVGFMLAWSHGFFHPAARKAWARAELSGACHMLAGTKAVILGCGRIGQAIAAKLEQLGVEAFGYSRHLKIDRTVFERKLREADWLVMALPSDTGTDNLLDAHLLAKLPKRCVIINIGRGNSVDEAALVRALETGRLAGAYLDVVKGEPFPYQRPAPAMTRVRRLRNLVTMPHASCFDANYMKKFLLELNDEGLL